MSVDVLYEPRFGDLAPTVEPLAAWAGRRSNAPPQQASPEPVGTPGWMDRLNWALGSSFVTCCLALSWVEYRPATDGIDVSLVFDPDLLPEHLVLSSGDGGGSAQGLQRPARGATYVFDQACGSYSLLETIHFVGAFFISPLARDAVFRVIEVMPVTDWSRRHGDFGDWLIELTGPSRRHTSSMNCRLTTHWAGEGTVHHLITNRLDLRSPVVFGIYKHRREIASFLEQVRRSPAQRSLLGGGRGVSPMRLFGSLLILRAWQWATRRVQRGQQEMTRAMEELSHDVLGLLPYSDMIRLPSDSQDTPASTFRVKCEEGLTASLLRSPPAAGEMQNWHAADAALTHG